MLTRQPLLSRGMRGTFHINSGTVGSNSYYMDWSDVDALNADGNEIAGQSATARLVGRRTSGPSWWA
jgi:hypothetical protein